MAVLDGSSLGARPLLLCVYSYMCVAKNNKITNLYYTASKNLVIVFMGCMQSFYHYKSQNSSRSLHTGSFSDYIEYIHAFGKNPKEAKVFPGESFPRLVHKHGGWEHNMWTGTSREHLVSKQWRWPQLPLLLCANYLSPISINSVQGDCLVNILLTALIKPAAKHSSPPCSASLSRTERTHARFLRGD